jgi:hypothetical protein
MKKPLGKKSFRRWRKRQVVSKKKILKGREQLRPMAKLIRLKNFKEKMPNAFAAKRSNMRHEKLMLLGKSEAATMQERRIELAISPGREKTAAVPVTTTEVQAVAIQIPNHPSPGRGRIISIP